MNPVAAVRRNALRVLEGLATPGRSAPQPADRGPVKAGLPSAPVGERVRQVWRGSRPNETLTWGRVITGDAFVGVAERHGVFSPRNAILEIGPGYGRVLRACLERALPFREYVALDVSQQNVDYLRSTFQDPRVSVVLGDAETCSLDQRFDAVVSSLVFKHLHPSFASALANLASYSNPGCRFCFDLAESTAYDRLRRRERVFIGGDLYVRRYRREEVEELVAGAGLELVRFDEVVHTPRYRRLVVIARKP